VRPRGLLLAIILAALLLAPDAAAGTDYLPDNSQWAGLSQFATLARSAQVPLRLTAELDWRTLGPKDALLVIYPRRALEAQSALAFIKSGGRLLLADDFGAAQGLFAALSIKRGTNSPHTRFHYQDNLNLPVAINRQQKHPLLRGVRAVVTNHPGTFRSPYPTLLGFGDDEQLLVESPLGKGRFIALSDPSVLINLMLRFDGNLQLAKNLVQELCATGCGKVVLVTGHFRQRPRDTPVPKQGLARIKRINTFLERINDFSLTKTGMRVLAFIAGGMALAALLLVLPLPRRDLDGRWLRPSTRPPHPNELRQAAMLLREDVEQALSETLSAPGPLSTLETRWIVDCCKRRGGLEAGRECAKLLRVLSRLPNSHDKRGSWRRLRDKDLEATLGQSHTLFTLLDSSPADDRQEHRAVEEQ